MVKAREDQQKIEADAKTLSSAYVDQLPLAPDAKQRIDEKLKANWQAKSSAQQTILQDLSVFMSENPETQTQFVAFKTLNPNIQFDKTLMEKHTEKVAECEVEALLAQNDMMEQDFRQACFKEIPISLFPPQRLFSKQHNSRRPRKPRIPDPAATALEVILDDLGVVRDGKNIDKKPQQVKHTGKVIKRKRESDIGKASKLHTPWESAREIKEIHEGKNSSSDVPEEEDQPSIAPARTIILTRKFGLKPCDKTKTVTPRIFARFEKVTNRLIRAGAALSDDVFEGKGLIAAKRFYDQVRGTPSMDALWQWRDKKSLQLNERAWRCAAQPAYFALRDHKVRLRLLRYFVEVLQTHLNLTLFFDSRFPQNEVFNIIYSKLAQSELQLTKGQVSRVYLGNALRWMRNLVKRGFRTKYAQVVADTSDSLPAPPHLAYELAHWLARDMPKFLDAYLRTLSRRLTRQVKRVLNSSQRTLPKNKKGVLIRRILKGQNVSLKTLDVKEWERVRKRWRDTTLKHLKKNFRGIDVTPLATHAVQKGQVGLTPERIMSLLFNFRPRRLQLGAGDLTEFKAYLIQRAITELEYRFGTFLRPALLPTLQRILMGLLTEPRARLKLPHFQKQTIPFGADDERVYRDKDFKDWYILALQKQGVTIDVIIHQLLRKEKLKKESKSYQKRVKATREYIEKLIQFDEENDWFEKVKKGKEPLRLQLRLEIGSPLWFELKTPKRFLKLVQAGYAPQKATLLKKAGSGLILALPFEKEVTDSQCLKPPDLTQVQDARIIAGLDLGLKTLAVLSIGEGDQPVSGAWGKAGQELARYFLDQKQLCEKREDWFKPLKSKAAPPNLKTDIFPNFKRRLTNLQREARSRQAERDECRNAYRAKGINHRRKQNFFRLNRFVKRIWRNMSNLHEELARQVATRILAACEHHRVRVLRMEDLRWAKHSRKYKVGYFLASWQIHWFFSQIQSHIADLAPRKGIFVEWVNAKHTSKRCSDCGYIGKTREERKKARKGKVFKCPNCGQERNRKWVPFQLDSDLNAARNIRVAPISDIPPSLYALAGGSPFLPPVDGNLLV